MVRIKFNPTNFEVDLEGVEKFETLKSKLLVPYSHVSAVEDATEINTLPRI